MFYSWIKAAQSKKDNEEMHLLNRIRHVYCSGITLDRFVNNMNTVELKEIFLKSNPIKSKYLIDAMKLSYNPVDIIDWSINKGIGMDEIPKEILSSGLSKNSFYLAKVLLKSKSGLDKDMTLEKAKKTRMETQHIQEDGGDAWCELIKEINSKNLHSIVSWDSDYLTSYLFSNPYKNKNKDPMCERWDPPLDMVVERYLSYSSKFRSRIGFLSSIKWPVNSISPQDMHDLLNNKQDFDMSARDQSILDSMESIKHQNNPLGNTYSLYMAGYDVTKLPDRWFFWIFDSLMTTYVDNNLTTYFNKYIADELYYVFANAFNLPDSRMPSELIEIVKRNKEYYKEENYGF
jgi:hypothetical protein